MSKVNASSCILLPVEVMEVECDWKSRQQMTLVLPGPHRTKKSSKISRKGLKIVHFIDFWVILVSFCPFLANFWQFLANAMLEKVFEEILPTVLIPADFGCVPSLENLQWSIEAADLNNACVRNSGQRP